VFLKNAISKTRYLQFDTSNINRYNIHLYYFNCGYFYPLAERKIPRYFIRDLFHYSLHIYPCFVSMSTNYHKIQPPTTKSQLILFLSTVLNHSIPSIESLGSGVVYAQLLYKLYPDFPIRSINENPKTEQERFNNLKIVQRYLVKMNIVVVFPVEKMVGCRLQDNLEVAQWMVKHYFEVCYKEQKKVGSEKTSNVLIDCNNDKRRSSNSIEHTKEVKNKKHDRKRCYSGHENVYDQVKKEQSQLTNEVKHGHELGTKKCPDIITEISLNDQNSPTKLHIDSDISHHTVRKKIGAIRVREPVNNINTRTKDDTVHEDCRIQLESAEQKLKMAGEFIVQLEEERNFYYEKLLEIEKIVTLNNWENSKDTVLDILKKKR
ncbi:Microtubule-binding protein involved in cell cycle control, partial [Trachipleistophora hominis]